MDPPMVITETTLLNFLPVFHIYGFYLSIFHFYIGARTVLLPKFDFELFLTVIQDYKVNEFFH